MAEQVKKGDFEPTGFEVSFSAIDNLKAMRIGLSEDEELQLRGRIDRMDLCRDEDHVYVKIIDYKSGTTSFDLAALFYGLQLQLVVYMDAAVEMEERRHPDKEVVPAGIFYYHIGDPIADKQEGKMCIRDRSDTVFCHHKGFLPCFCQYTAVRTGDAAGFSCLTAGIAAYPMSDSPVLWNRHGSFRGGVYAEYHDWTLYTPIWHAIIYCDGNQRREDEHHHKRSHAHGFRCV